MTVRTLLRATTAALAASAALALTGCAAAGAPAVPAASHAAASVTVSDAWAKAADKGMTGAFGTIANNGSADITLVSATAAAAGRTELHETITTAGGQQAMRAKEGGFTIPAGGTLTLAPGASHIMLMDVSAPLRAGDDVTLTLTFSDHSTVGFTARVKDFTGANETYTGSSPSAGGGMGATASASSMGMDH